MSSAITLGKFGFWLSSGLCESVYEYILLRASRERPELRERLPDQGGVAVAWRGSGMCPELQELVETVGSKEALLRLLTPEEELIHEIADNDTWRQNLRKALIATKSLLSGTLQLDLSDEQAFLSKLQIA
jgi:hypothetical protein